MRKDRDNPLAMSPKTPCQSQTGYGQEPERLHADLEAEQTRAQRAWEHLGVELRQLREAAEKEQQRAVRELKARRGCQKDRSSHRHWCLPPQEVNSGIVQSIGKASFCLGSGEPYVKLEQLLLTLYEKINGEQPVHEVHQKQDLELEKAIFLCRLLKAHEKLLNGRQRTGHPSYIFRHVSRKPTQEGGSNSHQIEPLLTSSRALLQRSHSDSPSAKHQQPSGRPLRAAELCTTAASLDTCRSSALKICHPPNTLHAGWDKQLPSCTESPWSDESPPSKCMNRNMEVS